LSEFLSDDIGWTVLLEFSQRYGPVARRKLEAADLSERAQGWTEESQNSRWGGERRTKSGGLFVCFLWHKVAKERTKR
jgi:hypothetical protein